MPNIGDTVISRVLGKSGIVITKSGVSDGHIFIAPNIAPYGGEEDSGQWTIYMVRWDDTTISQELRDEDFGGDIGYNNNINLLIDGKPGPSSNW